VTTLDSVVAPGTGIASAPAVAEPAPAMHPLSTPVAASDLRTSRFTLKGGLYSAETDEIGDDGWIFNASWMRFFTSLLALELEIGYLDASGEDGGIDGDVWGIPVMVNGRANVPLWLLDLYGGVGVGTIYYDAEAESGTESADDDGFLLAGNAFLGATVNLLDTIAVGLEAKYYLTEDSDELDEPLDALALMLTVGFSR
jgi:hypothetical protein